MAQTKTVLEGRWDCGDCSTQSIRGREKQCPNCGSPREKGKESNFSFDDASEVLDAKTLAMAKAGADWFCASCGTANRGDFSECRNCNSQRDQKSQTLDSGADVDSKHKSVEEEKDFKPRPLIVHRPWIKWVVASIVLTGAGIWYWGTRTSDVIGHAKSFEWKQRLLVEEFLPTVSADWQDKIRIRPARMPVNGAGEDPGATGVRNCVRKYRETVREACGVENVCRPVTVQRQCGTEQKCTTKSMGNGFAEKVCNDVPKYCSETQEKCAVETRYCDRQIFGTWCSFDTYNWTAVFDETLQGKGLEAPWPQRSANIHQRIKKLGDYTVVVEYSKGVSKKSYEWKFSEEGIFRKLQPETPVRLAVKNWGGVSKASIDSSGLFQNH